MKEKNKNSNNNQDFISKSFISDSAIRWNGININIIYSLNLKDMFEFVNNVVVNCISESGMFMPEVIDYLVKTNILTRYTDFEVSEDIEEVYELIYRTDIINLILDNINKNQFSEIISAIDKKSNFICNGNLNIAKQNFKKLTANGKR